MLHWILHRLFAHLLGFAVLLLAIVPAVATETSRPTAQEVSARSAPCEDCFRKDYRDAVSPTQPAVAPGTLTPPSLMPPADLPADHTLEVVLCGAAAVLAFRREYGNEFAKELN